MEIAQPEDEPIEDWRAKKVLKDALENANWKDDAKTIRIPIEGDREVKLDSRKAHETELRRLCSDEWHNNAMKINGDFVGICDDNTWVAEILEDYENRLEAFIAEKEDE